MDLEVHKTLATPDLELAWDLVPIVSTRPRLVLIQRVFGVGHKWNVVRSVFVWWLKRTFRPLRYERVYLPLCQVADTPFPIQVDDLLLVRLLIGHMRFILSRTGKYNPVNKGCWTNVGLMLDQRRRRWVNIKPTLGEHAVHEWMSCALGYFCEHTG